MKYIIRVYLINTQIRTFFSGKQMIMICCYNLGVLFSSFKYQMKIVEQAVNLYQSENGDFALSRFSLKTPAWNVEYC